MSEHFIATIGYERAALPDFVERLRAAGVERVIDVRAVAASRRAGFSKTILRNTLAEAGIDYLHLRDLGSPKAGRQAARAGRTEEMRTIFEAQMATPEALDAFEQAVAAAAEKPSALLCFEADAACCHRRILSDRLAPRLGAEVRDL
jgi:uncharacterized protein (DUF488 family)